MIEVIILVLLLIIIWQLFHREDVNTSKRPSLAKVPVQVQSECKPLTCPSIGTSIACKGCKSPTDVSSSYDYQPVLAILNTEVYSVLGPKLSPCSSLRDNAYEKWEPRRSPVMVSPIRTPSLPLTPQRSTSLENIAVEGILVSDSMSVRAAKPEETLFSRQGVSQRGTIASDGPKGSKVSSGNIAIPIKVTDLSTKE